MGSNAGARPQTAAAASGTLALRREESFATAARRGRFTALDAWRGIAALSVVFGHQTGGMIGPVRFLAFYLAVDFFFVLSGFVLAHRYWDELTRKHKAFWPVVVARFARLYPAHVFVLVALALAFFVEALPAALGGTPISTALREVIPEQRGGGRLWTFGLNLLLLHNVGLTPGGLTWNAPSWSISVEFFGSLVILGLVAAWRWRGIRVMLAAIAIVGYAFVFRLNGQLDATFETVGYVFNFGLVRCLAGIALGVLCLLYVRRYLAGESIGTTTATALELLALAAVVAIMIRPEYHSPWDAAFPLASALLVVVFSLEAGLVTRMLQLPPLLYLGSLSYAIYLVHWPLLFVMQEQHGLSPMLYYPAVLAAAVITHHAVEVPARRALMRSSLASAN
jgi:peptidoglycan/LPS O-acetylase OafA/YrhL